MSTGSQKGPESNDFSNDSSITLVSDLLVGGVAGQHTAKEAADNEPSKTPARDERRFARIYLSDCFTRGAPA
jgi:hypothetical protein